MKIADRKLKLFGGVLFLILCISSAVAFFHAPLAFLPAIILAHRVTFLKSVVV